MNKIIIYDRPDFQGLSRVFTKDVAGLVQENFNNCISSLKVIGNPWVAYEKENYQGTQSVYEEGEYASLKHSKTFSSLELVTEDLDDPQITVFEHWYYEGRKLVCNCETNLTYGDFDDIVSGHKVQRGAWVLYELENRGGVLWVARAGRDDPQYIWNNDLLTHLRPLKPGKPLVKAEIQWDKKRENIKTVLLDSITGENHGSEKQTFTTELHREYLGSITESFIFRNSTEISWGTVFEVKGIGAGNTLNVCDTFTVEKGSSNTRTTTESVRISLPANIAPHTKLTVNVLSKEEVFTVPVKLTITTNFRTKVEYGKYMCKNGKSIFPETKEEKTR